MQVRKIKHTLKVRRLRVRRLYVGIGHKPNWYRQFRIR